MNKASLESKIANILDTRDEIRRLEHNLELAKQALLKEMEEYNIDFVNTSSGNAVIRDYSVSRYDKFEVDVLVERLRDGQQIQPEELKKLSKSSDVRFVLVKGID